MAHWSFPARHGATPRATAAWFMSRKIPSVLFFLGHLQKFLVKSNGEIIMVQQMAESSMIRCFSFAANRSQLWPQGFGVQFHFVYFVIVPGTRFDPFRKFNAAPEKNLGMSGAASFLHQISWGRGWKDDGHDAMVDSHVEIPQNEFPELGPWNLQFERGFCTQKFPVRLKKVSFTSLRNGKPPLFRDKSSNYMGVFDSRVTFPDGMRGFNLR